MSTERMRAERAGTSDTELAGRREWVALAVLALPLLLVSMDVSILYFAVPQISEDLHASPTQQLWIFDVYGFVLAGMLLTMGALADRIGARRLLLMGAVAFSATSLCAAYAGSAGQLIAARAVLGIAGATLMPSTLAMIRTMFRDEKQRGKAIGAWTAVVTGGIGLGPVLSGVLLAHFWWGSVFLVNIPAMLLLLALGPVLLPATSARPARRIDALSSLLSLGAVLPTIYGIKEWAAQGFDLRWVVCLAFGLALGVLFGRRQLTHAHPMVDPALLRNRGFVGAVSGNAVATFALVGNAVFMTSYLQLVLGYRPLTAALWSLVPTLGVAAAAPTATTFAHKFGARAVATVGLCTGVAGFAVITRADVHSLVVVLIGASVLACGLVATMVVAAEVVLAALPPDQAGAGAAVSEAATELGGALGIALLGSVGTAAYHSYAVHHLPATVASGPAAHSLPGAFAQASSLPGGVADRVVTVSQVAYVHGLHAAAFAGATVLLVAAATLAGVRRRAVSPVEQGEECSAAA